MKYILMNAVSIICIIAAAVTAYSNVDGWGWFLFVGLCTAQGWSSIKTGATQGNNNEI